MRKSLSVWQSMGFIFTGVLGVILHFLYEWTGENSFVAGFSAVNESTWEHMKILFFPMFIFALIENLFIGKEYKSFWCVKLAGILFGVLSIPVIFYTLRGVFGATPDFINIAIFYVAAFISYFAEAKLLKNGSFDCENAGIAFLLLCCIALVFVLFTFDPPSIPIFQDPTKKGVL